jgi:hypothetical protein
MAFHGFVADAYMCGWKLEVYYYNGSTTLWTIRFELEPRQKTFYTQEDSLKAIHDYELPLMRIKMLEKALAARPGKLKEYVIRDGNANYDILDGEWQVKPKSDYVFKEVDATDL